MTGENNWRYSFEDLPNRDKNGELYSYVISQDEEISDYHTKYVKQIENKTNGTIDLFYKVYYYIYSKFQHNLHH